MTLGVIDVGTTSIHLLIGIFGMNGTFYVILKERELARVGEGGLARNRLTRKAMRRSLDILRDYAALLRRCHVDHIEAVATSAVRDAVNGAAFVTKARRVGIPLRVISGREEARLIYLGVVRAHRLRGPSLIITIGGGSAQIIHGDDRRVGYLASLPLGGSRLAQRFLQHDPADPRELAALRAHVDEAWKPVVKSLQHRRWRRVVVSSATVYQLMLAAHRAAHPRASEKPRQLSMTQQALRRWVVWLSYSTAQQRVRVKGVDPKRQDVLLPTAVALLSLMERCRIAHVIHRAGSLREGLVLHYWQRRRHGTSTRPLTVKNLAKQKFL